MGLGEAELFEVKDEDAQGDRGSSAPAPRASRAEPESLSACALNPWRNVYSRSRSRAWTAR
jgi:hypothetical protein